ncbi:MAG: hypothetical protein IJ597_06725, partial [Synergistaceae bacterium]|nr:hypothetical protein [Synergistaceae bacterium]
MNERKIKKLSFKIFGKDSLGEKILCGFAVAMFAAVVLAYFFAQNTGEITPKTVTTLIPIVFVLAILSYIPSLIIFRRAFTAMMFSVICWLGFYIAPLFIAFLQNNWPFNHGISAFIAVTTITIAIIATIFARRVSNKKLATWLFIGVLTVILIMNFMPLYRAVSYSFLLYKTKVPFKKDFVVDSNSKSPNIYWIHPDGMLSV